MADSDIKTKNVISTGDMTLYFCDFCNECYSNMGSFKLHYRHHKSIACETCGKIFYVRRQWRDHQRSHKSSVILHVCDVCNEVFTSKSELEQHHFVHDDVKPYSCDMCKSTFDNDAALEEHICPQAEEEKYVCDKCELVFLLKSSLEDHSCLNIGEIISGEFNENQKHYHHVKKKSHLCHICQKTFRTKALLKTHCCSNKNQKFSKDSVPEKALTESKKSNISAKNQSREKPHVCNSCRKAFSRKSSLSSHCCSMKT